MTATNDYVIIRQDKKDCIVNGIILPDEKKKNANGISEPYTGIVESVGDEVTVVKVNDRIVFNDLVNPWIIEDEDDNILVMKQSDIIGILEDEQ